MKNLSWRTAVCFGGIIFLAAAILVGCERPDPQEIATLAPTLPPLPPPTTVPLPTQPPVQVYVVIAQPTARTDQAVSGGPAVQVVTVTPVIVDQATGVPASPTTEAGAESTPLPENYFIGWAWSDSLFESNNLVTVDMGGIILRDRPSQEGRTVGIVMGFSNVFVVGKDRCGYSPIIVHATNMLSRTTPQLEVLSPEPVATELPPFYSTPVPGGVTTTGWAFTDELTILGQTAISGPLGVNLRADPCWGAPNLGFVPAGSDLIVLGLPQDDYTPVRVNNDVLQLPFDPLIIATVRAEASANRLQTEGETSVTPTPSPTSATATPTLQPSVSPSPTTTPSATAAQQES